VGKVRIPVRRRDVKRRNVLFEAGLKAPFRCSRKLIEPFTIETCIKVKADR